MPESAKIITTPPPRFSAHGMGYKPDTHDKSKDPNTRMLLGARSFQMPNEYSLEQYIDTVRDQLQTSCCVGFAFARGVHILMAALGTPILWPSPAAIYTVARAKERGSSSEPLQDEGSQPYLAVQGMLGLKDDGWGIPSDRAWPFAEATIDDEPDLEELEVASGFDLTGFNRIDTTGSQRATDVRHALSMGYPVCVGTQVDNAFENYTKKAKPITAPDPNNLLGGHMICVVGYNADGTFRVCNSWGPTWGDAGLFTADEKWIESEYMSDLYILTAASRAADSMKPAKKENA